MEISCTCGSSEWFRVPATSDLREMGGTQGELCECCGSERCSWQSCLWCCCRRGPRAEKNPKAREICRLRWNWLYLILACPLIFIGYNSIMSSFHQFVSNPTAQQLNGTDIEDKIEAGLGMSEKFYHIAVSSFSMGEILGAVILGTLSSRIPFWYSAIGALLCHTVGFTLFAVAVSGWMIVVARVLTGMFTALQVVTVFTYFGVSYQHYLDNLEPKERKKEEAKTTRVKDRLFAMYAVATNVGALFGPGAAVILAQFHINHFRSIAWYNVILGICYVFLQIVMFHGESKCHCEDFCRKSKCSLPERSKFRKVTSCSNLCLILIVGFMILARGIVSMNYVVYEELFNPILSDSFGFTIKQTSYFFMLLLFADVGGALIMLLMQRFNLNSRIIAIFGLFIAIVGLILMADWQSIPHDPCTDFSLYHHPKIANNLSDRMNPCLTAPSGCQWPTNGGDKAIVESIIHYMEKPGVQQPESIAGIQGPGAVLNVTTYIVAMNICESLRESQHHCHWIPKSFVTGELCVACPAICRGVGHTLNFIQFTIGAIIFQISYPISRVAIVMVLSDVVSKDYQSVAMGIAYASAGISKTATPLFVGAAYEGVQKRTFLAMSIVIATQVFIMLILVVLYHKLGQLREQQIHVNATEPLLSNTLGNDQDGASDKEDATEMSGLLSPEKKPLEDSRN